MPRVDIVIYPTQEERIRDPFYKDLTFSRDADSPSDFAIILKQALQAFAEVPIKVEITTPKIAGVYTSESPVIQQASSFVMGSLEPKSIKEIN